MKKLNVDYLKEVHGGETTPTPSGISNIGGPNAAFILAADGSALCVDGGATLVRVVYNETGTDKIEALLGGPVLQQGIDDALVFFQGLGYCQ